MKVERKEKRNVAIDQARFLAAAGVVWIHSVRSETLSTWGEVGRFAVPFFVGLAILFTWQSLQRTESLKFSTFLTQRFSRLYLPMISWSILYLMLKGMKKVLQPAAPNDFPGWSFWWGETAYHLWFIPFLMLVAVGLYFARKNINWNGQKQVLLAVVCLVVASVIAFMVPIIPVFDGFEGSLWMWRTLPAALCAFVLFAICNTQPDALVLQQRWLSMAWMVSVAALFLGVFDPGVIAYQTIAGIMFLVAVLNSESIWRDADWLTYLGRISMGIYFSHLLFVKLTEVFIDRMFVEAMPWKDLVVFGVALVCAIGLSAALYQSKRTRWLVA